MQRAGISPCMTVQHLHPGPVGGCRMKQGLPQTPVGFLRPARRLAQPANMAFFHDRQQARITAAEGVKPVGMNFLHGIGGVYASCRHRHHCARTRVSRHCQSIGQILRPVTQARCGRTHGASQNHRFFLPEVCSWRSGQRLLQETGGFLERIRAMCHQYGAHIGLCQPVCAAPGQYLPYGKIHILAVDLRHLLALQHISAQQILQAANTPQQPLHINLGCLIGHTIVGVCSLPGNGAACCQNHNLCHFLCMPLQNPENCLKIQLLDMYTGIAILSAPRRKCSGT